MGYAWDERGRREETRRIGLDHLTRADRSRAAVVRAALSSSVCLVRAQLLGTLRRLGSTADPWLPVADHTQRLDVNSSQKTATAWAMPKRNVYPALRNLSAEYIMRPKGCLKRTARYFAVTESH